MSKNIVYILGAGASANALPIVEEISIRLKIYAFFLFLKDNSTEKELLKNVLSIIKEIKKRRSFDTYAKELFIIKDDKKTKILKKVLINYLLFEQNDDFIDNELREKIPKLMSSIGLPLNKNNILDYIGVFFRNNITKFDEYNILDFDKQFIIDVLNYIFEKDKDKKYKNNKYSLDQRYINFLVDILDQNNTNTLNKIKILSWNYDTQFKKAIEKLKERNNSDKDSRSVFTKLNNMEIKINGSIDVSDIKFAWEQNENYYDDILSNIDVNFFREISDVIIIGYSFPFSNRKIDSLIFNYLLRLSKNINFYIQTIQTEEKDDKNFNNTREALESLILTNEYDTEINKKNIKIFKKYDNKSFFIPPHY